MAFEKVMHKTAGWSTEPLGDKITVAVYKDGNMNVSIGRQVCRRLMWIPEDRMEFLFGTGEHRGLLRIVATSEGSLKLTKTSGGDIEACALALKTKRLPDDAAKRKISATKCAYEIDDGGITLRLPNNFYSEAHRLAAL